MVAVIDEDKGVQSQIQLLRQGSQIISFWQPIYALRGEVLILSIIGVDGCVRPH